MACALLNVTPSCRGGRAVAERSALARSGAMSVSGTPERPGLFLMLPERAERIF